MKYDLLKECVDTLKTFRARKHKELGASVTAELDDVITRLEHCLETAHGEATVDSDLRMYTLDTVSRCLNSATNLADIVRKFFGPE